MKKTVYYKKKILKAAFFIFCFFAAAFACPTFAADNAPAAKVSPAAASTERNKSERLVLTGVVESVLAPVNPRETLMTVDCGDSTAVELILAPSTRYYPYDYYPCAGDKIRVNYVVLGIFKKYVIAYGVSLIEEFSGISKDSLKH
ncbi:MAG: hypothetical protein A2008_05390 [Candidatus Wallbacteria bacterium GWC2_49_35]|uniref:DUF5666 domain-containing protein n=1 Tax=Candidatus Wallbacteria bacterium GWC2_49_35 TaxID=1817813 RepID=A0A1F7WQ45_9BACT|nr:MAG: hypothetical protein A2008_05390 [Candidatus Wallbacteria bacterium GWC2_49_35]HBC74352.1 hypothetical protein [Candidatus Wallbacteria bacterium]